MTLDHLPVPPTVDQELGVVPVDLRVDPGGGAYALWHIIQANGLLVWRNGYSRSIRLSGIALREVAWAPDGLYFAALTDLMEGQPQLLRYRWGQPEPEVVLDSDRLKGYPRALTWDGAGNRLIYSDDEGLKALTPGGTVTAVAGPGVPGTVEGGVFAPGQLRYVTVVQRKLVLASAGGEGTVPLLELGTRTLSRVSWTPDGDLVAVELDDPGEGDKRQVVVINVPAHSNPKEIRRVDGSSPVLFSDRLFYLAPDSRAPMEMRLSGGEPRTLLPDRAYHLAGDPAAGRLYIFVIPSAHPESPDSRVLYTEVK